MGDRLGTRVVAGSTERLPNRSATTSPSNSSTMCADSTPRPRSRTVGFESPSRHRAPINGNRGLDSKRIRTGAGLPTRHRPNSLSPVSPLQATALGHGSSQRAALDMVNQSQPRAVRCAHSRRTGAPFGQRSWQCGSPPKAILNGAIGNVLRSGRLGRIQFLLGLPSRQLTILQSCVDSTPSPRAARRSQSTQRGHRPKSPGESETCRISPLVLVAD
jgi:hypothetical protein